MTRLPSSLLAPPSALVLALALLLPLAQAACSDDDESPPGPEDSSLRGIWQIAAWTRNTAGCDAEGESVLESRTDRFMLVQACSLSIPGMGSTSWLHAVGCETAEACEEQRCTADELILSGHSFQSGDDRSGWRGQRAHSSGSGDQCKGYVGEELLKAEGTGLKLESRTKVVEGIGEDADGFCDLDRAKARAGAAPCTELEVIRLVAPAGD